MLGSSYKEKHTPVAQWDDITDFMPTTRSVQVSHNQDLDFLRPSQIIHSSPSIHKKPNFNPQSEMHHAYYPNQQEPILPPQTTFQSSEQPGLDAENDRDFVRDMIKDYYEEQEETLDDVTLKSMTDLILKQAKDPSFRRKYRLPRDQRKAREELNKRSFEDLELVQVQAKVHQKNESKKQQFRGALSSVVGMIQTVGSMRGMPGSRFISEKFDEEMQSGVIDASVEEICNSKIGEVFDNPYINIMNTLFTSYSKSQKKEQQEEKERQNRLKEKRRKDTAEAIQNYKSPKTVSKPKDFQDYKEKRYQKFQTKPEETHKETEKTYTDIPKTARRKQYPSSAQTSRSKTPKREHLNKKVRHASLSNLPRSDQKRHNQDKPKSDKDSTQIKEHPIDNMDFVMPPSTAVDDMLGQSKIQSITQGALGSLVNGIDGLKFLQDDIDHDNLYL